MAHFVNANLMNFLGHDIEKSKIYIYILSYSEEKGSVLSPES